jgi:hypothetical protein
MGASEDGFDLDDVLEDNYNLEDCGEETSEKNYSYTD